MSFGQVKGSANELPTPLPSTFPARFQAPYLYRHVCATFTRHQQQLSISEPHSAPVSAPVGGLTRQHFGFPPAWNTLPGHTHCGGWKGPESIGGWYSEPSPLARFKRRTQGRFCVAVLQHSILVLATVLISVSKTSHLVPKDHTRRSFFRAKLL
jgi:hypothetical protein